MASDKYLHRLEVGLKKREKPLNRKVLGGGAGKPIEALRKWQLEYAKLVHNCILALERANRKGKSLWHYAMENAPQELIEAAIEKRVHPPFRLNEIFAPSQFREARSEMIEDGEDKVSSRKAIWKKSEEEFKKKCNELQNSAEAKQWQEKAKEWIAARKNYRKRDYERVDNLPDVVNDGGYFNFYKVIQEGNFARQVAGGRKSSDKKKRACMRNIEKRWKNVKEAKLAASINAETESVPEKSSDDAAAVK